MKKSIIAAGAASVALAAMPVVGVFAAPTLSHTDTILLTVSSVCTLGTVTNGVPDDGTDATTHADGTRATNPGTWGNDPSAEAGTAAHTNTLSETIAAGTTDANMGSTTFTVRCNNAGGYELQARSGTNDGNATAPLATMVSGSNLIKSGMGGGSGSGGAWVPATDPSYWNFMLSGASTGVTIASGYDAAHVIPTSDTKIAEGVNGNLNAGQSVTVTYGAGINNTQPSGTYTGTVIYTLVPSA